MPGAIRRDALQTVTVSLGGVRPGSGLQDATAQVSLVPACSVFVTGQLVTVFLGIRDLWVVVAMADYTELCVVVPFFAR